MSQCLVRVILIHEQSISNINRREPHFSQRCVATHKLLDLFFEIRHEFFG